MMRLPNSYGSIVKLKGKRRKPYAVRISTGYKMRICVPNKAEYYPVAINHFVMKYRKTKNDYVIDEDKDIEKYLKAHGVQYRIEFVRKRKYIAFFADSKSAHAFLARYNSGEHVEEHKSLASEPSFKAVYNMYIDFIMSLNEKPSETTLRAYKTGFNNWSDIHDLRFCSITVDDLQKCLTKHGTMSKATISRMITVVKAMYKYANARHITDQDPTRFLFAEHTKDKKYAHTVFTDEEIDALWKSDSVSAKSVLFLIYTGMRVSEFLQMKISDVHVDERYMIGGIKTEAGRNRVIPIHRRIIPIVQGFCDHGEKYLFPKRDGGCYDYRHYRDTHWKKAMNEIGATHRIHDTRHTAASKMEASGIPLLHQKLILGHSIRDLTQGTYTHVDKKTLISDMDKWK